MQKKKKKMDIIRYYAILNFTSSKPNDTSKVLNLQFLSLRSGFFQNLELSLPYYFTHR